MTEEQRPCEHEALPDEWAVRHGELVHAYRDLRADRDRLRSLLSEVLDRFWQKGHPGRPCVRTGWIQVETVEGWRAELEDNRGSR